MKVKTTNFLFGIFLIILGCLFLLHALDIFFIDSSLTLAAFFVAAGLVFLLAYFFFKKGLWTLIVGVIGLFIGAAIYIERAHYLSDDLIPVSFFVLTGLTFFNALRYGRKNWWALIPGGYCFIFAAHIAIDMLWLRVDDLHGVIFFLGTGLIFGIIYLLKNGKFDLDWAKYPSLISFIIGIIILLSSNISYVFNRFLFPAILIVIGILLLFKSLPKGPKKKKMKKKEKKEKKEKKKKQKKEKKKDKKEEDKTFEIPTPPSDRVPPPPTDNTE
ncbi:MAG: hypothetical protein R6V04_11200 [bacterium]